MIKAVIFDVDGVLLDSFEANFLFFERISGAAGFKAPTREEYKDLFHIPMRDVIKKITNLNDDGVKEIWERARGGEFDKEEPKLNSGVEDIVKILDKEYLLAIVTSRVRPYTFEGPLNALRKFFKVAISYEDTENHKPHPEPLILAASKLGVRPEECVYIGDVENDAIAARAAGMKIIIYSEGKVEGVDGQTVDFREILSLVKNL